MKNDIGRDRPGPVDQPSPENPAEWVREAVAASGDIAYRWDILTDQVHWVGNIDEILGERGAETVHSGHSYNNRIHPEDLPTRLKALSDHFSQGSGGQPGPAAARSGVLIGDPYECEYRIRNGQGVVIWVHDRGRAALR